MRDKNKPIFKKTQLELYCALFFWLHNTFNMSPCKNTFKTIASFNLLTSQIYTGLDALVYCKYIISCNGHAWDTVLAHLPSRFLDFVKISTEYAGTPRIFALEPQWSNQLDNLYRCNKNIFTIAFVAFIMV